MVLSTLKGTGGKCTNKMADLTNLKNGYREGLKKAVDKGSLPRGDMR
jgi:hypothetical protein